MISDKARKRGADVRRQNMEANIEIVRRLQLRGIKTAKEIKAHLERMNPPIEVTERTIWRWKKIIKRRHVKAVRDKIGLNKSVEELAIDLKNTFEEVTRETWKIYHSKDSSAQAKISALKNIKDTARETLETMQTLGLVHKEPEKQMQIGPDGQPIDPTINVNIQQINNEFTAFLHSKFTEPVGATGNHHVLNREEK